jgi:hypothetical protein
MLTITLDINGHVASRLHVRRTKPVRSQPSLDTLCNYVVIRQLDKPLGKITEHRYGDGADQLAAKVLKKFGRKAM